MAIRPAVVENRPLAGLAALLGVRFFGIEQNDLGTCSGLTLDSRAVRPGDLYVANDMGQSILVFRKDDQGDVAPSRVIKGSKTRLSYPAGVFVDAKNKELWASNIGNSSATVYPLNANVDVAPLRIIRGAEENKQSLKFGKTEAVIYDSKREQVLVPN